MRGRFDERRIEEHRGVTRQIQRSEAKVGDETIHVHLVVLILAFQCESFIPESRGTRWSSSSRLSLKFEGQS
jgi:hypothetical protein